jgi:hypothetical protein
MDASFYASQFDTARELLANDNPAAVTGLYSILDALHELYKQNDTKWQQNTIHNQYKDAVMAVYLIYHTERKADMYKNKQYTRPESFLIIQNFKRNCFKEITQVLELIQPNEGIQWRIIK